MEGRERSSTARRGPLRLRAALLVIVACLAATALARAAVSGPADRWAVASPDGVLRATVAVHDGAFSLTVDRRGKRVVQTPLGRPDARGLEVTRGDVHQQFDTPAGKRRHHVLDARRMTLEFAH